MSQHPEPDQQKQPDPRRPRGLAVLLSLSADRLIAVLVIIVGILIGVWMFGR